MKYLAVFLLLIACSNAWKHFHNGRRFGGNLIPPPVGPSTKNVQELWFEQKLDHFDHSNSKVWNQRYFVTDDHNQNNKTAFLFIGGEGAASPGWMTSGAWIESAKKYGALCFQVEHRFYGESQPTANLSTENLRFLNAQQALADLANFIVSMNELYDLPSDVKWIAFGGSYSGNLAAWMRMLYPHLIVGASSSSGPVLAKLDFEEYFGVVANDLVALHSQKCADVVKAATDQVADLLASNPSALNGIFNLCTPIEDRLDNPLDIATFWSDITGNFAGIAQYNNPEDEINIASVCDQLTANDETPEIDRLAEFNKLMSGGNCLDYNYDEMIEVMKDDTRDYGGMRQWIYQTCTEYGYYQTSNQPPQIFGNGFPLNYSIQQCMDIYGPQFNEAFLNNAVDHTNILFGGVDLSVSNVIYVHGTVDPWHALGVLETVDEVSPAILVNGTSHCMNMYSTSSEDPPELAAAKVRVDELIGEWLKQ